MRYDHLMTKRLANTISLIGMLLWSCSSSRIVFEVPQKVVGEIIVVGNEPFTRLAVRTEDGESYLINCDDEIRASLLSHQGKIVEIFYNEIQKKSSGEEIKAVKISFLFPKGSR